MRRVLVLCLACLIAVSFACSKKEPQKEKEQDVAKEYSKGGLRASLIDPVSKEPVDIGKTPYYYIYNDTEYHFNTEENMEAFKKDPEKYIGESRSVTPADR